MVIDARPSKPAERSATTRGQCATEDGYSSLCRICPSRSTVACGSSACR